MSIGEILAAAREESGLSVEDVSRETRIRGGLIRAIENDDFGPCGGAVYARGHIRNIAAIVGVDAGPLVAQYDREHGGIPQPVENPTPAFDPEVAARSERRRPNWAAAMAVTLAAITIIAGVNLVTHAGSDGAQQTAGSQPSASASTRRTSPSPRPKPAPSDAVALVPTDGVSVHIRIVGSKCWVHVAAADGQVLFEGTLDKGTVRDFTDPRRVRMTIGNAGALSLVVNGRDLGVAGAKGAVVHRSFGPATTSGSAG